MLSLKRTGVPYLSIFSNSDIFQTPPIIREGIVLKNVSAEFQDSGILIKVSASKPPGFYNYNFLLILTGLILKQAHLYIEGEEFWQALGKLLPGGERMVSSIRIGLTPIKLVPRVTTRVFKRGNNFLSMCMQRTLSLDPMRCTLRCNLEQ